MEAGPDKENILIIAGEASGDKHAASIVREIVKLKGGIDFWGIGGDNLRGQHVETLFDIRQMHVVGFIEILKRYRFFRNVLQSIVDSATKYKPQLAILVDYPGFNLRLAKKLKRLNIPVVYYIAPQVWAWKESRLKTIRKYVDDLIVIFPFEVEYFRNHGITAHYFGHPLAERVHDSSIRQLYSKPQIAYFPGSRTEEIDRHMPIIKDVIQALGDNYHHVIPRSSTTPLDSLIKYQSGDSFEIVDNSDLALRNATAALVKSGTSALEALLYEVPCAVFYKTSRVSYHIAKQLIKTKFVGIINILAGKLLVQEFIQDNMQVDLIVHELSRLIHDDNYRETIKASLGALHEQLQSTNVAANISRFIAEKYLSDSEYEQR